MPKKQRSDNPRKGSARPQPEKGHIQDSGPISENIAETWQPKTIEDVVERVLEHIQERRKPVSTFSKTFYSKTSFEQRTGARCSKCLYDSANRQHRCMTKRF